MNPDNVPAWGCPWHGRVERDELDQYWLVKHDGARVALAGRLSASAANTLYQLGLRSRVQGTHLVRVPGHVMQARTEEQLEADAEQGHEWLGAAMLSGQFHCLHGTLLGGLSWIYSAGPGQIWRLTMAVVSQPVVGSAPAAPLTLRLTARRFGVLGISAPTINLGDVSAASCIDISPPSGWGGNTGVGIQSIRSDGGELVLELRRNSAQPSSPPYSGVGYYRLEVACDEHGEWSTALSVLAKASEMYSSSASGSVEMQRVTVASIILQSPTPENPDIPTIIQDEVLLGDDEPSGPVSAPPEWRVYEVPSGIEQQRTVHCGFVYDADDALHRVERRLRITHECNIPAIIPSVSGVMTRQVVGGALITDDQRIVTIDQRQEVTSEIVVEMLLDGVVVSDVSTVLTNAVDIRYRRVGYTAPVDYYTRTERGQVDIAGDVIRFDRDESWDLEIGWLNVSNWPHYSGVAEWVSWSGGVVSWRASTDPAVSFSLGQLRFPEHAAITVGALRRANNVWSPAIFCGRATGRSSWISETTGGSVSRRVPGALIGPAVGPGGSAAVGAGAFSSGAWPDLPIEYDYLHDEFVEGGGVF